MLTYNIYTWTHTTSTPGFFSFRKHMTTSLFFSDMKVIQSSYKIAYRQYFVIDIAKILNTVS